jgi:hypothetical protein
MRFALSLENLSDANSRPCLDEFVAVYKLTPQSIRNQPPHGRFAGAHKASNYQVAMMFTHMLTVKSPDWKSLKHTA